MYTYMYMYTHTYIYILLGTTLFASYKFTNFMIQSSKYVLIYMRVFYFDPWVSKWKCFLTQILSEDQFAFLLHIFLFWCLADSPFLHPLPYPICSFSEYLPFGGLVSVQIPSTSQVQDVVFCSWWALKFKIQDHEDWRPSLLPAKTDTHHSGWPLKGSCSVYSLSDFLFSLFSVV